MGTLLIGNNRIGNEGCSTLTEKITANTRTVLSRLELDSNHFDKVGASRIANLLRKNRTITSLNISENCIEDEGAKLIASTLVGSTANKVIKNLELDEAQ